MERENEKSIIVKILKSSKFLMNFPFVLYETGTHSTSLFIGRVKNKSQSRES